MLVFQLPLASPPFGKESVTLESGDSCVILCW